IIHAASLDIGAVRIALEQSLCALHLVNAAVRPRPIRAVLDTNGPPERGLNQAGVDVAEREDFLSLRRVGGIVIRGPVLKPARRAAHRDEVVESMAAVDVEAVGDRPEAVCRIRIAVELARPRPAPQALVFLL